MTAAKILVFDSGIGGFSVFQHIRQTLPGLSSCYLMDNELFPYGIQPDHVLTDRIVLLCEKACAEYAIDMVVVACNTASTLALPALRERLNIPVIGVVPAIKTAANLSRSKHIALLATPATINRPYIDQLILEHGNNCQVTRIGSSELVKLAEKFWFDSSSNKTLAYQQAIFNTLDPVINSHSGIDQIVLGCTHFPIISETISQLFPNINLIDSGDAIARRVNYILGEQGFNSAPLTSSTALNKNSEQNSILNNDQSSHDLLVTAEITDKLSFLSACRRIAPYQSFNII